MCMYIYVHIYVYIYVYKRFLMRVSILIRINFVRSERRCMCLPYPLIFTNFINQLG